MDEVNFQRLTGATDVRQKVRSNGVRYCWLLSLINVIPDTSYTSGKSRITPDDSDSGSGKNALVGLVGKILTHSNEKQPDNLPYDWRVSVVRTESARVSLEARLIDLDAKNTPILADVHYEGIATHQDVQSNVVTVHGSQSEPSTPQVPLPERKCDDALVVQAHSNAADSFAKAFRMSNWIYGNPMTTFVESSDQKEETHLEPKTPDSAPPIAAPAGKAGHVVRVGQLVVISGGNADGLRKGDLVTIATPHGTAHLWVVTIGAQSMCKPASDADRKLFKYIGRNAQVTWVRHTK